MIYLGLTAVGCNLIICLCFLRPLIVAFDGQGPALKYLFQYFGFATLVSTAVTAAPLLMGRTNLKETLFYCSLVSVIICIAFVDWLYEEIPDRLQFMAALIALALGQEFYVAVAVAALLSLSKILYEYLRKRSGLGWGDVKLLSILALIYAESIFLVTLIACGICAADLILKRLRRKTREREVFAFAPYIAAAVFLFILLPGSL